MQRVMITGGPGSGKSTLARIMGERTGLPAYHMDQIHWTPGWVERAPKDKIPLVLDIVAKDQWVFEGGNSVTYPDRVARADTFIWLDLPVTVRFARVVWRTIRDNGKVRPDMAPDCPEGFHGETLAFWRWIWRTRHAKNFAVSSRRDEKKGRYGKRFKQFAMISWESNKPSFLFSGKNYTYIAYFRLALIQDTLSRSIRNSWYLNRRLVQRAQVGHCSSAQIFRDMDGSCIARIFVLRSSVGTVVLPTRLCGDCHRP